MKALADEVGGLGQHPVAVQRVEILGVDIQGDIDRAPFVVADGSRAIPLGGGRH